MKQHKKYLDSLYVIYGATPSDDRYVKMEIPEPSPEELKAERIEGIKWLFLCHLQVIGTLTGCMDLSWLAYVIYKAIV